MCDHVTNFEWKPSIFRITCLLYLCSALCFAMNPQDFVVDKDVPEAVRILDAAPGKNTLPCYVQLEKHPQLDFMLRYLERIRIECSVGGGELKPGTKLYAVVRITTDGHQPSLMLERFDLPKVPLDGPSDLYVRRSQALSVSMNAGFALGQGRYLVEVVLTDRLGNTFRKQRRVEAGGDKVAKNVAMLLDPGEIASLGKNISWKGPLAKDGPHLTLLLHAYSQGRSRIEEWDRAYLLESVATLLRQIPCASVRLIAFNLDKQNEVFRDDHFDADGFARLEKALAREDLATMPYQALKENTWAKFLVDMTASETAVQKSNEVIFLGAWGSHEWDKVPKEMIAKIEKSNARVFYLKYFARPGGASDGVERLTRDLHGSVFTIYSPLMLQRAINKMKAKVGAAQSKRSSTSRPNSLPCAPLHTFQKEDCQTTRSSAPTRISIERRRRWGLWR